MTDNTSCDTLPETEPIIKRFRRGDVREDGKVFWAYKRGLGGREYWVHPEDLEHRRDQNRKWGTQNSKKVSVAKRERQRTKKRDDPLYILGHRARRNLRKALASCGTHKTHTTSATLGCSWAYFRDYITELFLPGMSWNNRDQWHLDHIVPQALAKTEQDVRDLNHYTNLRPLWAADNLIKGDSLPPRELVPEHLLRFI